MGIGLLSPTLSKAQETNVEVTVTNNMTLTWLWNTQNQVNVYSQGNGTVNADTNAYVEKDGGSYWVDKGSNIVLRATGDSYSRFDKWLPSNITSSNLEIQVNSPTNITAVFAENYASNNTPLRWLANYGLTNDDADDDTDGFKTWQEYIADTNPTNSLSYLQPLHILAVNGIPRIVQPESSVNRYYSISSKTNLLDSLWQPRTNSVGNGTNLIFDMIEDQNSKKHFYRGGVRLL